MYVYNQLILTLHLPFRRALAHTSRLQRPRGCGCALSTHTGCVSHGQEPSGQPAGVCTGPHGPRAQRQPVRTEISRDRESCDLPVRAPLSHCEPSPGCNAARPRGVRAAARPRAGTNLIPGSASPPPPMCRHPPPIRNSVKSREKRPNRAGERPPAAWPWERAPASRRRY